MKNWVIVLFFSASVCVLSSGHLVAQIPSTAVQEKDPEASAYLSLIALGSVPPRRYTWSSRQVMEGGAGRHQKPGDANSVKPEAKRQRKEVSEVERSGQHAVLLAPQSGTVPPAALYFQARPTEGGEKNETTKLLRSRLRVGFNNATGIQSVPAGRVIKLERRENGSMPVYSSYVSIPAIKPRTQSLAFLLPQSKGTKPWQDAPAVSLLSPNSKALADKNILVRNFSEHTVAYKIGAQKFRQLKPGQRGSLKVPHSRGYWSFRAVRGKQKTSLLQTSIRVPVDSLTVIAFYNANPETNAGEPVGVFRTAVRKLPPEQLNEVREPHQKPVKERES